jgi:DmsE family decaheme c-type cytochrome
VGAPVGHRRAESILAATGALSLLAAACLSGAPSERASAAWTAGEGPGAGCVACHAEAAWNLRWSGQHATLGDGPGCLACHAPHPGPAEELGPSELVARCEDCHSEVTAEFRLPFQHPVGTTVACTSCHPPHGLPRFELRQTVRHEACVECHLDKRGPFAHPHRGNHHLGCLSCHEAHGSGNRRLLTHSDPMMLCLSCHEQLEHVLDPGFVFQKCLSCHTEVHGSHWDNLLRY